MQRKRTSHLPWGYIICSGVSVIMRVFGFAAIDANDIIINNSSTNKHDDKTCRLRIHHFLYNNL